MSSLYDELMQKVQRDPRLTKPSMARYDLSLLLFNAGANLRDLWPATDAIVAAAQQEGRQPSAQLEAAVTKLRPIFGERSTR